MTIPTVKYAFLRFSLDGGTKFIAYFHLLLNTVMFTLYIVWAFIPFNRKDDDEETLIKDAVANETETVPMTGIDIYSINHSYLLMNSVFIHMIMSCFFVYGVIKVKKEFIFPWILFQISFMCHSIMFIVLNAIFTLQRFPLFILSYIVGELMAIAFEMYCSVVVYSYLEKLIREESDEVNLTI